jgi:hypothetical protein
VREIEPIGWSAFLPPRLPSTGPPLRPSGADTEGKPMITYVAPALLASFSIEELSEDASSCTAYYLP